MKTSWIVFLAMAYMAIFYFSGIAEQQNNLTPAVAANIYALGTPSGTNFFGNIVSNVTAVWSWFLRIIPMVFLWNGTVWQGGWLYFYFFVCIPIMLGLIFSFISILRGVHNS